MNDIHIHYSEVHQTLRLSFTKDKLKYESTYTPEPAKWRMWLCAYHDANANYDINGIMNAYFDIITDLSDLMPEISFQSVVAMILVIGSELISVNGLLPIYSRMSGMRFWKFQRMKIDALYT